MARAPTGRCAFFQKAKGANALFFCRPFFYRKNPDTPPSRRWSVSTKAVHAQTDTPPRRERCPLTPAEAFPLRLPHPLINKDDAEK